MKCVATFPTRMEAEILKSALEANDIPTFVTADDAGGMYPTRVFSMGGAQVIVDEKDVEKAKKIIREF